MLTPSFWHEPTTSRASHHLTQVRKLLIIPSIPSCFLWVYSAWILWQISLFKFCGDAVQPQNWAGVFTLTGQLQFLVEEPGKAVGWQCCQHRCLPSSPDAGCRAAASMHGSSFPLCSGHHEAACHFKTQVADFLRWLIWPLFSSTCCLVFFSFICFDHIMTLFTQI